MKDMKVIDDFIASIKDPEERSKVAASLISSGCELAKQVGIELEMVVNTVILQYTTDPEEAAQLLSYFIFHARR